MANENVTNVPQAAEEKELSEILQIRRDKLAALQEAGADPFQITKYDVTHHGQDIKDQYDALEGQTASVAGRMMSKRIMGKASFCHVQDLSGTLQISCSYIKRLFLPIVLSHRPWPERTETWKQRMSGILDDIFKIAHYL